MEIWSRQYCIRPPYLYSDYIAVPHVCIKERVSSLVNIVPGSNIIMNDYACLPPHFITRIFIVIWDLQSLIFKVGMITKITGYKRIVVRHKSKIISIRWLGCYQFPYILWNAGNWVSRYNWLKVIFPRRITALVAVRGPIASTFSEICNRDSFPLVAPMGLFQSLVG